jgi:hypothetical protein
MKLLLNVGGMIFLSLIPLCVAAQEIGYMDLSDNIFRERYRQTRTVGGGCSGSPHAQPSQSEVTATVVSLDKVRYRIGEEATFEIKVLNSGKKTIIVPWTQHLGDLEPADTDASYKYRVGVTLLIFRDPEGHEFAVSETLYGSPNVAGSLRELSPGQWFTVKGQRRITPYDQSWGKKELRDSGFVIANVSGFYRQDRGSYSPKDGGSDNQMYIPMPCTKANTVSVRVEQP